jgi:glycosyltransferase involved in cell wall biosynthesis
MDRIKILYLTTSLDTYGPAGALVSIATSLDPERFEVLFCQCEGPAENPIRASLEAHGIPVHTLNSTGPLDLRLVYKLVRLLRAQRVDVLHTRLIRADFYGRLAGRLSGVPLILTNLCDIYSEHFKTWHGPWLGPLFYAVDRATLGLAHRLVANSDGVKADLVNQVGISADKVSRIYNGIDAALYAPQPGARQQMRRQIGLSEDEVVVGTVARLHYKKGLTYLLEAAHQLGGRFPGLRFIIAGDGPERRRLEEQARELGLGDRLIFLGDRTDISDVLAAMDVFAFPSLFEGLPNAILEAMAAGLPVVASDVAGNNEVVQDGLNGYLVPVQDAAALAEKIALLAADAPRRQALAAAGRQNVAERFSIPASTRQFELLYTQDLAGTAPQTVVPAERVR